MTKKLAVFSTPLHYARFVQEGFNLNEFEIWCDDERYYQFLEGKKVQFNKLEEDLIGEHWEKINTWACETAAKWIMFCRKQELFAEIDWAMIICMFHGYLLAPILKFYHLSKFLLLQRGPYREVVIFYGQSKKNYPHFLGNSYLNYFLELQCKAFSISTIKIDLKQGHDDRIWQPETQTYFRKNFFPYLKKIINQLYACFVKPWKSIDVLAFGTLRHLGPMIKNLDRRGLKVALYDFEYHTEQFLFCLKKRIPYLIPECFQNKICIDVKGYAEQVAQQFDKAFKLAANSDLFMYDGIDLKAFIQTDLFGRMPAYFQRSAEKINDYKRIRSTSQIKSILIDDDFSIKGAIFAGYFKSIKSDVFCVSHANFAVNARVPVKHCNFYQGYGFVNSEFEKSNYVRRGWEPNHLFVTGIPRYDRLISMMKTEKSKKNSKRFQLLFCGTGLWSFSADVYSYVGHQRECFGAVQIPVLNAVCSAIKGLPIDLIIKPHSLEMVPYWKKFIGESPVKKQLILKKASDNIFKLLLECDAMILAYWSTTIIESAIAGKPTIYVDFRKVKNQILYEYSSKGFCHVVNSEASLRDVIQKICNGENSFFTKPISKETKQYYLGQRDGKASKGVSDFITAELMKVSLDHQQKDKSSEKMLLVSPKRT